MDSSRVVTVALAVGLLVGLGAAAWLWSQEPVEPAVSALDANLASITVEVALSESAVVERADLESDQLVHMVIVDGADRLRLRVTHGLDELGAQRRLDEARGVLFAMFGERQAPYPGELSNTLKCPDVYKPVEHTPKGDATHLIRLYANERFGYGGCNADLLSYRATVGLYYDADSQRLLQAEYFSPVDAALDKGPERLSKLVLGDTP